MEKLKQLIAYVAKKKGSRELREEDFVKILSYDRGWLPPNQARRAFATCVDANLLEKKNEHYEPTFEIKGFIIPLDFIFTKEDSERYSVKEDVFTLLLDHICRITGKKRKEVLMDINAIKREMSCITIEIAALIYCKENNIDCSQFYDNVEKKIIG